MNKCSFCGLENSEEAVKCRHCETALGAAAEESRPRVKQCFLPYFLSYFLVASGMFLYDFIVGQRAGVPDPEHFLVLNTTLSTGDVVDKLVKAGVPKDSILGIAHPPPAVVSALLHHFALFAVVLFAFWGLTKLFQRFFTK